MKRAATMAAAGAIAIACLAPSVSCGARTGLDGDLAAVPNADGAVDGSQDAAPDAARLPCVPGPIALVRARPAVMFVLDRSRSMAQASRWQILTNALAVSLPSVDQTMHVGALVFPSANTGAQTCSVPSSPDLSPALGNVKPLLDILRAQGPNGSTPTADALDVAGAAILGYRAATTARTLVLATDGAPVCNGGLDPATCRCAQGARCTSGVRCLDDVRTIDRIRNYATQGVPTYVIGIHAGSNVEYADVLDAMAVAGGRPRSGTSQRYYAASSEADLTAALVAIRQQVGACTFLTTSVPGEEGSITVTIDGKVIPFDPSGEEGWLWGNEKNGEILLVGTACPGSDENPTIIADVSCDKAEAGVDAGGNGDAATSDAGDDAEPEPDAGP